jgi:hypothetical protein
MHEERRRSTKQDKLPDPQVCKYFVIIHYSEGSNRFMLVRSKTNSCLLVNKI